MGDAKLKSYTVTACATVSVFTRVVARSKAHAIEIAESRGMPGLCHQCAGGGDEETGWSLSDGIDGSAHDLTAEADHG
jgi:hypothetical protein